MDNRIFQPHIGFDQVFLDVDSTLVHIEGIDELALLKGVGLEVSQLTERCMSVTGMNPEVYQQRLNMIRPQYQDLDNLAQRYIKELIADVQAVVALLQRLKKDIYLISGGIYQALLPLARHLAIKESSVHAVRLFFDKKGYYAGVDQQSPLIQQQGKAILLRQLIKPGARSVMIGDGLSDVVATPCVDRMIAVTFSRVRQKVMQQAHIYLQANRFSAVLPLLLDEQEVAQLTAHEHQLYSKSLSQLKMTILKYQKE